MMDLGDLEVLAWRLFEESSDAILLVDPATGEIQLANPVAQKLTGMPWRRLRSFRLNELINSEHQDRRSRLLSAVQETRVFHSQEDYLLYRDGQDPLPINVSVSRVHTPSGSVGLVVLRDISDRRRAEKALRELSGQLHRQVRSQTEDLRAVNSRLRAEIESRKKAQQALRQSYDKLRETIAQREQAEERANHLDRLKAREQIAEGTAHEVKNSMARIMRLSELILAEKLEQQVRQWVQEIRTTSTDISTRATSMQRFRGQLSDHESRVEVDLADRPPSVGCGERQDQGLPDRRST